MMILVFHVNAERFGIDAARVIEVGPLVTMRPPPSPLPGFLGWCNFRGAVTPVIDLSWLIAGRDVQSSLSTRLLFVDLVTQNGPPRRVGLAAQRVVTTVQVRPDEIQPAGVRLEGAPFLGGVVVDKDGNMIQVIEVDKVLRDTIRKALDLAGPAA